MRYLNKMSIPFPMSVGSAIVLTLGVVTLFLSFPVHHAEAASMTFTSNTTITTDQTIGTYEVWTINPHVTLTIASGVTITVTSDGIIWLQSSGTINNEGSINNDGSFNMDEGTMNNYGTINNSGHIGQEAVISNYGTINNSGRIGNEHEIHNIGDINNDGNITNSGGFTNDGTLNNEGVVSNYNTFYNVDTINNSGTINNYSFSTFNNSGTINNEGTINNSGTSEHFGGFNNSGTINNKCGATFNNTGTFTGNPVNYERCYNLELKQGVSTIPDGGNVQIDGAITANATTDSSTVTQVNFSRMNPDSSVDTEIVPLTLGSAQYTFTPTVVGHYTILADFGDGVILEKELDISFNVIPESPVGLIALVVSSFAALGAYMKFRTKV